MHHGRFESEPPSFMSQTARGFSMANLIPMEVLSIDGGFPHLIDQLGRGPITGESRRQIQVTRRPVGYSHPAIAHRRMRSTILILFPGKIVYPPRSYMQQ